MPARNATYNLLQASIFLDAIAVFFRLPINITLLSND
uniref:Uncharacterized protein n=1 Tax=Siphoviridae sp. cthSp75 TaxID=2826424 RepID=A0A8S5NDG5_9CAUD|nr:MAG TPA: hypothetical protein [Siphoviridae sp. cthSp75]